jgi:hypothetical protein
MKLFSRAFAAVAALVATAPFRAAPADPPVPRSPPTEGFDSRGAIFFG